jgi:hypothetical protein
VACIICIHLSWWRLTGRERTTQENLGEPPSLERLRRPLGSDPPRRPRGKQRIPSNSFAPPTVTVRCTGGRLDSPQERGAAPCGTATGGWPEWLLRPPRLSAPRPRQRRRRLPASTIPTWRRGCQLCFAPKVGRSLLQGAILVFLSNQTDTQITNQPTK